MSESGQRSDAFRRNTDLEELLGLIQRVLAPAETHALTETLPGAEPHPAIFVMGPLRSGTTLFTQWLGASGLAATPTNLLSRFYSAPVTGALIQRLLTDPKYSFRNELFDCHSAGNFESENGKTSGALSPNEFWYFWRHFLPFAADDRLQTELLTGADAGAELRRELAAISRVFDKPFALKAMILNYHIPLLGRLVENSIFVALRRDPVANVASALRARERQFGTREQWYSFPIPEYAFLKDLPAVDQVAGQVHYINKAVAAGFAELPESRRLTLDYEAFCANPADVFHTLCAMLSRPMEYRGPAAFDVRRSAPLPERDGIEAALARHETTA